MLRPALLPIVLAVLAFFVGLGGPITDSDEAFYAEAAREMVESGNWLTPHYNYEPRFQKPILYYWLTAGTYLLSGPGEIAARWWAACSGVGLVLVTVACARRWFDEPTALLAGAITATNFGYFALARMALPDLPLTFFITLAIYSACMATLERTRSPRAWLVVTGAALGLGFLTKGPVAIVIPALVVIPLVLIERRRLQVGVGDILTGGIVAALIGLPWYIAMWRVHGTGYLESFFLADNFERFATDRFNEPRAWWFYLPIVAGGLLPWTPMALVWLGPIRDLLRWRRDIGTLELRLLFWALLPLLFYTVSVGKQPRYILPILPPLAVLLASSIVERTRSWRGLDGSFRRRRADPTLVAGAIGSGLTLLALGALLYRTGTAIAVAVPDLTPAASVGVLPSILIGLCGAAVIVVSLSGAWRLAPMTLAVAALVSLLALRWGALDQPGADAVRRMAGLVREARTGTEDVTAYEVFVRNLIFYTGLPRGPVFNEEHLRDYLLREERVLAVLPTAVLERVTRDPRVQVKRIAEVPYIDPSALRLGTLLAPESNQIVQRVVLVSNR